MTTATITDLDSSRFLPRELQLQLKVRATEVIEALYPLDEDRERAEYAETALRIGVLAMQKARGTMDVQQLRHEGERLLDQVRQQLAERNVEISTTLADTLRTYLDPKSGVLPQRIERLVSNDGELAQVLQLHVGGADSKVARTLAEQVGHESPLFRLLDPSHKDSLLTQIATVLEQSVHAQREQVLREFSLDNHAGALCNLLAKLTDHQGKLRAEFQQDLDGLVKEFSLDDESSALSRLVGQVERAQRGIVQQFSLDDDASALSRLRKELNLTIATFTDEQRQFQTQISKILTTLEARKDAEARSTTHGLTFENQLGDLLCTIAGQQGDLIDDVGHVPGALNRCKVGDFVITVGSDQVAAGGRIVVEAKEDKSVTDSRALSEIQRGRENREAHVGIFVFSKKVDPDKETFRRCGDDILVVWDAEEPSSDIYVQAAISVAKAILHHKVTGTSHSVVDLQELDASVAELARLSDRLNNMEKYNSTIRNSTDKIDAEIRGLRKTLEKECHTLAGGIQSIKECA